MRLPHLIAVGIATAAMAVGPASGQSETGQPDAEYRDNSQAIEKPIVDEPALIPMAFIPAKDQFAVISYREGETNRSRYKAARFTIDGDAFEMLASKSSVTVSSKPWHPARDRATSGKDFAPRLARCYYSALNNFSCTLYPSRDESVTFRSQFLGGRDYWTATISPANYITDNGITLGSDTQITISDGVFKRTKDYSMEVGMFFPTRPTLEWQGSDAKPLLDALVGGRDIKVSFEDEAGTPHSYTVPSRDFRIGAFVLQRVWPELVAVNKANSDAAAE